MVLKAVRLSLPILFFWRNHFSMICQVWRHFLQSRLSSDNEIEIVMHEELDLQIKRMLVNLLYNSILFFSYSDVILLYIPACVFFSQFILWFERLKMAYTVSNLSWDFLHSVPHVLNIFYHNFPRVVLHFHCPRSYLRFGQDFHDKIHTAFMQLVKFITKAISICLSAFIKKLICYLLKVTGECHSK